MPIVLPAGSKSVEEVLEVLLSEIEHVQRESAQSVVSDRSTQRELDRLRRLLDLSPDGVILVDAVGSIRFANEAAAPLLSIEPRDTSGLALSECLREEESVSTILTGTVREGELREGSFELGSDTGEAPRNFEVSTSYISESDGVPGGRMIVLRDVSREKAAERSQVAFLDSVTHELRTPLTSISAYVEMLVDGEAHDEETQRNFYNIIFEETQRISNLIDNLLNISMMESGLIKLDTTPVRMKRLIEESMETIRPQCQQKNIILEAQLDDRLPTLDVDKSLLSVAIVNLLSNAAKYTPQGGTISITTSSHEEGFQVHIRDTGVGIAEAELEQIFEKFYRASSAGDEKGSGIGLPTARQVVRMHGGEVRVESELGKGSEFVIVLPRSLINASVGD